jgi:hypothetical protein
MANSTVLSIDPNFLLLDTYSVSDENLIANQEVTSTFNPGTDYIEYYIYGLNNSLLYPSLEDGTIPYSFYSLLDNDVYIDPSLDLQNIGFDQGSYNTLYNFYSNRLNSSFTTQYFISEISSDRTEIRLDSNDIDDAAIISSVNDFIAERQSDEFFPDFLLNFGSNRTVIANNIQLDGNTVLIKLYDPLPPQFGVKTTLWVVEEVADPIAYNIIFEEQVLEEEDTSIQLKGPNLNLDLKDQINNSTGAVSLSELDASPLTGSYQQLQSLFNEEGIQINVDYTEYSNFINFSSAKSRIENFEYKLQLIESYQESAISGSNVPGTNAVSDSKVYYENLINDTITNFDGYEYFLYFSSGSKSWPKSNTEPPFVNLSTTDQNAIDWYNEQITSASLYDELNQDNLFYDIPEYLRNDSQNQQYINFVEMVGQHFDNIWIYLKDISNKYNADNRIDAGISKDLVAQTLRDFSLKIYQNNFSSNDIYSSFLGLTPSGSLFPFPEMTDSLPTPSGFEYVDTFISSSTDAVPLDDINKRIYKRLYHNLPYLFKSKGTISGIKTLLNIYGIPDTILRVSEFGGKDKVNTNDYDYWYNKFNYKFNISSSGDNISTDWVLNSAWNSPDDRPSTLQFRFNAGLYSSSLGIAEASQSLWHNNTNQRIVLEYDTDLATKPTTFSGSILDPEHQYANLKFTPDGGNYATVRLPFLDGGWWSIQVTRDGTDFTLWAANKIYSGNDGTQIGFFESSSISGNDALWKSNGASNFPSQGGGSTGGYEPFRGSYQEIRYYTTQISESVFKDYVMNPLSFEGNSIASGSLDKAPDELAFRATLGGELYTGSTSIHPKVTGSWATTSSFASDSNFTITQGSFSDNREYIFFDQPAVGIKNRINDKIRPVDLSLPVYNTTEGALIPDANTLSNQRSVQQDKSRDDIYTNNINLLEVTFSPQNELNDDIIQQLGHFNIGDLIGDPREISSSAQSYPELDKLRREYFLKYVHENYDFNDYVRLIKFFDNSLFKMIKDFVPARTSLASGITIKPHILERQKYPLPQAYWEDLQHSGSVKSFPLDYATGSLQVTSGGDGGSFKNFNHLTNFTQSWSGSNATPSGSVSYIQSDAPEFINGEFSGSTILVEDGELNPDNPVKYQDITSVEYQVTGSNAGSNATSGKIIWNSGNRQAPGIGLDKEYFVSVIWISETSENGVEMQTALSNLTSGDEITLTVSYGDFTGFVTNYYTKTVKLPISDISGAGPGKWRIKIDDDTAPTLISTGFTFIYQPSGTGIDSSVILNPYINIPNFTYSDFNAVIGNATDIRPGTLYQDIDYSSNATTPVNFNALISGSADKALIPDSNYSTKRITKPRYEGSRSTSNGFNLNSNEGGLGSLPNVEQDRAYFAYFNYVGGTAPEWGNGLIDRSGISVRYFVDMDGNVLEPTNDSKDINLSIVRQTFTEGETSVLSFDDESGTSANFGNLIGEQTVFKSGKTIAPIIYTQTQSISDTTPGGATGSLEFYQGDGSTALFDYRLTNNVDGPTPLTISQSNQIIPYVVDVSSGNEATVVTSAPYYWAYRPTSSPKVESTPVTLNFTATVRNAGFSAIPATFDIQFFKAANNSTTFTAVGTPVSCDFSISSVVEYSITYSDSDVSLQDRYQLRAINVNIIGSNNILLGEESFFRVSQTPLPDLGPVSNFFTTNNSTTLTLHPDFNDYYGLTQNNLENDINGDPVGFFKITNPFILQPGDEIRFNGTEEQVWTILEVHEDTNPISFTLNKFISSFQSTNWFLVRRYIDAPGNIIIEADKPAGGTAPGFFMPLYATKGIEDNFDKIIQKLKTDQLI